jgi:hypothetical protein
MQDIPALFIFETAQWDRKHNIYVDHKKREEQRTIQMSLERDPTDDRLLLIFIGGPTGHEVYDAVDLWSHPLDPLNPLNPLAQFCICGGTVNSWPRCLVPWNQVYEYLETFETELKRRGEQ